LTRRRCETEVLSTSPEIAECASLKVVITVEVHDITNLCIVGVLCKPMYRGIKAKINIDLVSSWVEKYGIS